MTNYRIDRWMDDSYEHLLGDLMEHGEYRPDRTGVGAYSTFGRQLRYDLRNGFPLITTKNVHFKSVVGELLWFLSGSTDKNELEEKYGVTIWREWDAPAPRFKGDLGPIYGEQWCNAMWMGYDDEPIVVNQIKNVIEGIKADPFGRRHIVNSWNVGQINDMALPPCHMMFQFWVGSDGDGKPVDLSLQMYQRSQDVFLGLPFNIASYALLLEMVAAQVGLPARELVITGGDVHLYANHLEQAREQSARKPYEFPTVTLDHADSIFEYTPDMIHLHDYKHHPHISAPVAV